MLFQSGKVYLQWRSECHYKVAWATLKRLVDQVDAKTTWTIRPSVAPQPIKAASPEQAAGEKTTIEPGALDEEMAVAAQGEPPAAPTASTWLVAKAINQISETRMHAGSAAAPPAPEAWWQSGVAVGEGTYARCQLAQDSPHGPVVVKIYKEAGNRLMYLAEVDVLTRLSHPHVIQIVDVNAMGEMRLAMRYGGRALRDLCKGPKDLPQWPSFCKQLLSAAEYLHGQRIVHTDIKPANLVVDGSGVLQVIDLGSAIVDIPGCRTQYLVEEVRSWGELPVGTLWYRAPEACRRSLPQSFLSGCLKACVDQPTPFPLPFDPPSLFLPLAHPPGSTALPNFIGLSFGGKVSKTVCISDGRMQKQLKAWLG